MGQFRAGGSARSLAMYTSGIFSCAYCASCYSLTGSLSVYHTSCNIVALRDALTTWHVTCQEQFRALTTQFVHDHPKVDRTKYVQPDRVSVMLPTVKPRSLPINHPLDLLCGEIVHTRALLAAYPFLATHVTVFDGLLTRWQQLQEVEFALARERVEFEARVIVADDGLDILCSAIAGQLLIECNHNRKAPEYLRYFGNHAPSQLKRPVLGKQLDIMRTWVPSLRDPSSSAILQDYGQQLAALVIQADAAEEALSESRRKRKDHEIGLRQDFINALNAARLEAYGQLASMPLSEPARNLPHDFAHKFFLRSKNRRNLSVADMEQRVIRERERLEQSEALLTQLLAEEEARRRRTQDAELRAAQQAVAETERAHAEAEAKLAEILARHADEEDDATNRPPVPSTDPASPDGEEAGDDATEE